MATGVIIMRMTYDEWKIYVVKRAFPKYFLGEHWCSRCKIVYMPSFPEIRCPNCGALLRTSPRCQKKKKRVKNYVEVSDDVV